MSYRPDFDPEVLRAMQKWPDVPRCYGWLGLDRRGNWRIRGEIVAHARAVAFLGRHYDVEPDGSWFVQNGPQRVFVELEYTPWIMRFDPAGGFTTHTGRDPGALVAAYADDEGNVLLEAAVGVGLVDDRDLTALAALIDGDTLGWGDKRLPLRPIERSTVPARFGFVARPRAD
ncbi:MAG: DUF2946 family protein [Gammaproteobacteria bacterium]